MTHAIVIIDSQTPPPPPSAAAVTSTEPEFKVHVEFRPADNLTPAQIGNEVARIQRRVNQIIDGSPD